MSEKTSSLYSQEEEERKRIHNQWKRNYTLIDQLELLWRLNGPEFPFVKLLILIMSTVESEKLSPSNANYVDVMKLLSKEIKDAD